MDPFLVGQKPQESIVASPLSSCLRSSETPALPHAQFLCLQNEGNNLHLLSSPNNSDDQTEYRYMINWGKNLLVQISIVILLLVYGVHTYVGTLERIGWKG